jgi:hypothetical protein
MNMNSESRYGVYFRDVVADEAHHPVDDKLELGGDVARCAISEIEESNHDHGRQEDENDGAVDRAEDRLELEELENVLRGADRDLGRVAPFGGEYQVVQSSSLSFPRAIATISRATSTRYVTTAETPNARRSTSTKLATSSIPPVTSASRTKRPIRAAAWYMLREIRAATLSIPPDRRSTPTTTPTPSADDHAPTVPLVNQKRATTTGAI